MHSVVKGCFDLIDGATEVEKMPENEAMLVDLARTGNVEDIKRHLRVSMLFSNCSIIALSCSIVLCIYAK